jgi:hypothetical protein
MLEIFMGCVFCLVGVVNIVLLGFVFFVICKLRNGENIFVCFERKVCLSHSYQFFARNWETKEDFSFHSVLMFFSYNM